MIQDIDRTFALSPVEAAEYLTGVKYREDQLRFKAALLSSSTYAEAEWDESKYRRDRRGRFAKKGLPELPWVDPPPPTGGGGGGKAGGYSADTAAGTNTKLGEIGEKAFVDLLGGTILHPEGKGNQSPLDVHVGDYGVECKACSTNGSHYKASPKKHEIAEKEAAAKELGVTPALSIVVLDADTREAFVYWREGLATGRLLKTTGWKFAGKLDKYETKALLEALGLTPPDEGAD